MSLARKAAETYFDAWRARDFDRLRTVLASDVDFAGPLGTAHGIEECLAGLRGMAESVMVDIVVHARAAEGPDVITWFDLITADTPALPTANWSRVDDEGRIIRIRAAFDPRPLFAGSSA